MTTLLYIDTETYSTLDIRKVGGYRYTESCELMLTAWALGDEPVQLWDATIDPEVPDALCDAIEQADYYTAHNAQFDRNVLAAQGIIANAPTDWFCTSVLALTNGLPAGLDQLCTALGMDSDQGKMKEGKQLVNRFCSPAPKNHKAGRYTRHNDPVRWQTFCDYCVQDVVAMREAHHRMLPYVYEHGNAEHQIWVLDQISNDYGLHIDVPFVRQVLAMVDQQVAELNQEIATLTHDMVQQATNLHKLTTWVASRGVKTTSLDKAHISALLRRNELPEDVRRVLTIRQQLGKTSTSKYTALLETVADDQRLRGVLQFYGAGRTGRDAGRLFQPQNLPRPTHGLNIEHAIRAAETDLVPLLFDDPMDVASSLIRSAVSAAPGHTLVVADLANIEGRMLAWLAGEGWKLDAFREYDAGTGPDLYKLAYARAFSLPVADVTSENRQIGKVMELALGYQGAVGAFKQMAAGYGVDLPEEQIVELVGAWRAAHPATTQLWRSIESVARKAISHPGKVFRYREIGMTVKDDVLLVKLPSGRFLMYREPQIEDDGRITYMGVNGYTRKWERLDTYGGKMVENITQAAARDILMHGFKQATDSGMDIVLRVHDELVAEADETEAEGCLPALCGYMTDAPDWAEGLPLAAEGYISRRYKK